MSRAGEQGTVSPVEAAPRPIDPAVRVGHVHLRTTDLGPIRDFYVDLLGFDVVLDERGVRTEWVRGDVLCVSAGGYHHHLAFVVEPTAGPPPVVTSAVGLHHLALNFPTLQSLAEAIRRLEDADWPLRGIKDFGTHIGVLVDDPDGNGLELAWDRPPEEWPASAAGEGWKGWEPGNGSASEALRSAR